MGQKSFKVFKNSYYNVLKQVFALSRTAKHLDTLKEECPGIHTICVDVGNWNATREAVQRITPIHLLVNNAAVAIVEPALEASPENFDFLFSVNVKAVMNITQVVCKDLVKRNLRGSVVNVSSQASHRALKNHLTYASTKAALDMMTKVI